VLKSTGVISIVAATDVEGYGGDDAAATAARFDTPTGVSVDSSGNVYIADTGNQRIRQLGGGAIATIVGSGQPGYGGKDATPNGVNLNMPKAVAPDSAGNLAVADKLNQRVRNSALPALSFSTSSEGIASAGQSVTLSNSGMASISVASLVFPGPFVRIAGGTCSATPIVLAPAASCIESIAFLPVATGTSTGTSTGASTGASTGSLVLGGAGLVNQTILLARIGTLSTTTTSLITNANPALASQPVVLQDLTTVTLVVE